MAQKHDAEHERSESGAYETRDVRLRPLLVFIAGLAVIGVFVYLVVFLMFRLFTSEAAREEAEVAPSSLAKPEAPAEVRLPPEPRIQADPGADMTALRRQEDAVLTTYGWVDRQGGIVRVPIDVAMAQVLEEGLPVRQPDSAPPASGAPVEARAPQGETKKAAK